MTKKGPDGSPGKGTLDLLSPFQRKALEAKVG